MHNYPGKMKIFNKKYTIAGGKMMILSTLKNIHVRILSRKNSPENPQKNGRFEGGGICRKIFADPLLKGGIHSDIP